MTLKIKVGIAMLVITGVLLLLPNSVTDWLYFHDFQSRIVWHLSEWVLPVVVAIASFWLLWDGLKALIAGAISWMTNLLILGASGVFQLDCGGDNVTPTYGLSQACESATVYAYKLGIAAILCFNLFLLYRLAVPKTPKATTKTK